MIMTYSDISLNQARIICKRMRKQCEKCPLRRERKEVDEKGNERIILMFCAYVLLDLAEDQDDKDLILYEEIKHEYDLKELLKTIE